MKNNLYIAVLLLLAGFFVACEKDTEPFEGPYRLTMGGPGTVRPETTRVYTLGEINNPDTYTWSIEGPAEIIGSTTGATVSVQFNALGAVVLSVTNGRDSRTKNITVSPPLDDDGESFIALASSVNDPGVLRSGETDTLFLTFNQSLANNPTVSLITADTAFVSGTLGTVEKKSGMEYYVLYTAGEGNGTPTVQVSGVEANEAFGGATMANQVVNLHRVDNVAPVADIAYSQEAANEGSEVTMTVTFNEPVTFTNKAANIRISGAGVTTESDTLVATEDPRVYTLDYTVTGEGNGKLDVEILNAIDLAGNALSAINNADGLTIDNDAPTVAGTATDNDTSATVSITSTESGTGMYLIRNAGQAAPTTIEEFMSMSGAASGSVNVEAGRPASVEVALGTGSYNVYYLAMDQAGNYSSITSSNLVMD